MIVTPPNQTKTKLKLPHKTKRNQTPHPSHKGTRHAVMWFMHGLCLVLGVSQSARPQPNIRHRPGEYAENLRDPSLLDDPNGTPNRIALVVVQVGAHVAEFNVNRLADDGRRLRLW